MNTATIFKTIAATALIGAASFASAAPITSTSAWTVNTVAGSTSGSGDYTTVTNPSSDSLQLFYSKGSYFCAGCGNNYWSFSTVADKTGTGTFDFTYSAFDAWYMATSDISFQVNGVTKAYFPGYDIANAVSLAVNAGDIITVKAHEYNYDGTYNVNGTIVMKDFGGVFATDVPEPASLALIGVGLLGAGAARRKRKQA